MVHDVDAKLNHQEDVLELLKRTVTAVIWFCGFLRLVVTDVVTLWLLFDMCDI